MKLFANALSRTHIKLLLPVIAVSVLGACNGEDLVFRCLGATSIPGPNFIPAIELTLNVEDGSLDAAEICEANVSIVNRNMERTFATAKIEDNVCYFESREGATGLRNDSRLDVEIHLPGYQSKTLDHANREIVNFRYRETCAAYVSATLEPSALTCADGYTEKNGICVTRSGCEYPLYEQLNPTSSNDVFTHSCVSNCENGPSSQAAICR